MGLNYRHGTGHGIGAYGLVHESPTQVYSASNGEDTELHINMYKVQIMKKLDVLSGSSAESFQQQSSCRSTQVRVYKKEEHELLPGQFFSDEPGLYIEGEFGIRLETVLRWLLDTLP